MSLSQSVSDSNDDDELLTLSEATEETATLTAANSPDFFDFGESCDGASHISGVSQRTRKSAWLMPRVGQKSSMRLPSGILVSLLRAAVAESSSTTVYRRSRFSAGSCAMRAANCETVSLDTVR